MISATGATLFHFNDLVEVLELVKLVDGLIDRVPAQELACSCTERTTIIPPSADSHKLQALDLLRAAQGTPARREERHTQNPVTIQGRGEAVEFVRSRTAHWLDGNDISA